MPEGPEVFVASMCGSYYSENRQFTGVIYQPNLFVATDVSAEQMSAFTLFGLDWQSIGKQIHIRIIQKDAQPFDLYLSLTTCGQIALVPNDFVNLNKVPLAFRTEDMSLCVYHKQGKFMRLTKEAPEVGPSILKSKTSFENNIKKLLAEEGVKWKGKPLCNIMLDQRWFNGVGNYLRSEVMYKSGLKPCEDAFEVLSDSKKLKRIVDELHELMGNILGLCVPTFNPYDHEKREAFNELIQCYGKMKCSYVGQRKIWYFPGECGPLEEQYCKPAADTKKEHVGPFAGWCAYLEQVWEHYGDIRWSDDQIRAFGVKPAAHAPKIRRTGGRGRPRLSRQNKVSSNSRRLDTRVDKRMPAKVKAWSTSSSKAYDKEMDLSNC